MSAPLSVEGGRTTASVSEQQQLGKTAKSLPAVANQPQEPRPTPSGSVRQRPILFSGPMVRALLDGTKTQTRRVVKGEWASALDACSVPTKLAQLPARLMQASCDCPYGAEGDRLWVRETLTRSGGLVQYAADHRTSRFPWPMPEWRQDPRPSIHMPRWASRLTLKLTGVRVERVQDISEADAKAEGVLPIPHNAGGYRWDAGTDDQPYRREFATLWDSLNAKRGYGWDVNPWVWVLEFRPLPLTQPTEDPGQVASCDPAVYPELVE